jgi:2Fe-2S ferredoxin
MNTRARDIVVTVVYSGEKHCISTYEGEYRNLMHLITDKIFVEGFGDCKGMCRCGTCLVEVSGLQGDAAIMEENEAAIIRKLGAGNDNTRLACQLMINENLRHAAIAIKDQ